MIRQTNEYIRELVLLNGSTVLAASSTLLQDGTEIVINLSQSLQIVGCYGYADSLGCLKGFGFYVYEHSD